MKAEVISQSKGDIYGTGGNLSTLCVELPIVTRVRSLRLLKKAWDGFMKTGSKC